MAYEVYLGGCALYGVSSVEESAARDVAEHDGIGSGAFAIAKNAKLKSWSIRLELTQQNQGQAGWRAADAVLDALGDLLKSKNGQRLVIISDRQKLSKPVLLRDLKYETSYQGVYSVTLSLIEYVKGQVRASGVPSVTRPGTRPKAPDTFKVGSAFDVAQGTPDPVPFDSVEDSSVAYPMPSYIDPVTGRWVNPAGLFVDKEVSMDKGQQAGNKATTDAMSTAQDVYNRTIGPK